MKTLKLTKNKVIKAIKTEPLRAGAFFKDEKTNIYSESCFVCAVGAVLKNSLDKRVLNLAPTSTLSEIAMGYCRGTAVDHNIKRLLNEKNYLGALSNYFEYIMQREKSKHASASVVKRLVNFVEKNFPKKFNVKYEKQY